MRFTFIAQCWTFDHKEIDDFAGPLIIAPVLPLFLVQCHKILLSRSCMNPGDINRLGRQLLGMILLESRSFYTCCIMWSGPLLPGSGPESLAHADHISSNITCPALSQSMDLGTFRRW